MAENLYLWINYTYNKDKLNEKILNWPFLNAMRNEN